MNILDLPPDILLQIAKILINRRYGTNGTNGINGINGIKVLLCTKALYHVHREFISALKVFYDTIKLEFINKKLRNRIKISKYTNNHSNDSTSKSLQQLFGNPYWENNFHMGQFHTKLHAYFNRLSYNLPTFSDINDTGYVAEIVDHLEVWPEYVIKINSAHVITIVSYGDLINNIIIRGTNIRSVATHIGGSMVHKNYYLGENIVSYVPLENTCKCIPLTGLTRVGSEIMIVADNVSNVWVKYIHLPMRTRMLISTGLDITSRGLLYNTSPWYDQDDHQLKTTVHLRNV